MSSDHTSTRDAGARQDDPQLVFLSQAIQAERRKRQWSLDQLAEHSGVSRSMISKVERCKAAPTTTTLAKIAEALVVTFSALMSKPVESEILHIKAAAQPILQDTATGSPAVASRRCCRAAASTGGQF